MPMEKSANKTTFVFDKTPIDCKLKELQPLRFVLVSKTPLEPVWDYAVSEHHYLGYGMMIGPRLKYMVFSGHKFLAALSFNQAAYKVGSRDSYIGWSDEERMVFLPLLVNNNRFLVLPWVDVKNLASHVLSQSIKLLRKDWPAAYGKEPILVETFVDAVRYKGTCYKAANFLYLGETLGYARKGGLYKYHGDRKGVYVYPLIRDFRNIIGCTERPKGRALNQKKERRPEKMMIQSNEWNPKLLEDAGVTSETINKLGQLLLDYHDSFSGCYTHKNQEVFGETYLMGLLSSLERKSAEPIALRYLDEGHVRGLQRFFKASPWNYGDMKELYQARLCSNIAAPGAMLTLDPSDFPKKGKESAGVARQHCGALGKTDNCQSGVFVGYTSSIGYGLVDCELYMPEKWFADDYEDRRNDCAVPEGLQFQTKIEIALRLVKAVGESGNFPAEWLGCDSFFGRNAAFLDAVAGDFYYFADLLKHMLVYPLGTTASVPEYCGTGFRPRKLKASTAPIAVSSIAADANIPWKTVNLGEGAKGPITAQIKCLRVHEYRDKLPGRESWLYIRKHEDGKIKYSLSNAPADIPLEGLNSAALMRWPIEQCFEECKSNLGMDHYEIRSYTGWHKHMLFVFLAHLFLLEVRLMFKKNTNTDASARKKACGRSCSRQDI